MLPVMAEDAQVAGWLVGALLVALLLPLVPHGKLRYYAVYVSYVTGVSAVFAILLPFFIFRVRNVDNLRLAAINIKKLTKILGIKWELRNGEILKKERAAVIVANHQSILDIMGMCNIWKVMGKCTAVGKKELLYAVPFGPGAWLAGLVFIDRKTSKLANTQLNTASNILQKLKVKFWMFPEGTRNKSAGDLLSFKKGAFRIAIESQVPIIPLVYSPYYFIDSKKKTFDKGKVIITVLDAISTEGMTLDDVDKLTEKTYNVMSEEWKRLKNEMLAYQENKLKS